jgi:hypothetical protein
MRVALLLTTLSLLSCRRAPLPAPERPHGIAEHRAEAAVQDEKAAAHEAEAQQLESHRSSS